MRAALTTLWILSAAALAGPVCSAAEIAPTTGKVDKDGNEILEGDETPAADKSEGPKKRPKSRFAEKPKEVSLPAAGEDLQDDGGADDVPLPTHPLLRRAVLNKQRRGASEAPGGEVEVAGEVGAASAASPSADQAPAESEDSRGWMILLGVLVLLGAGAGWVYRLYSLGKPNFSKPRGTG